MKTAAILPKSFVSDQTGNANQARCTVRELRKLGVDLAILYYDQANLSFYTEDLKELPSEKLESWMLDRDLFHVFMIPAIGIEHLLVPHLMRRPALLSTVFWKDLTRLKIALRNTSLKGNAVATVKYAYTSLFRRDCRWCNAILPNSWAEGRNFMHYHLLAPGAMCFPVPNAVDIALRREDIMVLSPLPDIPWKEYFVCPGIIHPRKNQLALLRAAYDLPYPVVLVGGVAKTAGVFELNCRRAANDRTIFLGHCPSDDMRYWRVLRYARGAVLCSDCETPGIAMLEAAYVGCRPVVTSHGGTSEYYGMTAEYLEPSSRKSIREALERAWARGRLNSAEQKLVNICGWDDCAAMTLRAYETCFEYWARANL